MRNRSQAVKVTRCTSSPYLQAAGNIPVSNIGMADFAA